MRIDEARKEIGMSRRQLSDWLNIPYNTVTGWENGKRTCPSYLEDLILEKIMSKIGNKNFKESFDRKLVTDIYGNEVVVVESKRKLVWYSNKTKKAGYNCLIFNENSTFDSFTDYEDEGVVINLDERIWCEHSPVTTFYAIKVVSYNASKLDPDKVLKNRISEYVKNNEEKFFDEYGDLLEHDQIWNELTSAGFVAQ